MLSKPTIATVLNTKYVKADGTCGISMRITYARKKKFFGLPISLTSEDYTRAVGEKPRGKYKELALEIAAYERKAKDIINSMSSFSWEKFEMMFFSDRMAQKNVYSAFEEYINDLKIEKRYGTASSCQCALNSLRLFRKDLSFVDINKTFLQKYEEWMREEGKSPTTVGIYLRALRAIVNAAIRNDFIILEPYPFGRGQYIIPSSSNPKRALATDDIKKISNYTFSDDSLMARSRDYWLFMFLANGMNMKDMALLKFGNMKDSYIEFERAKTKRTKRVSKKIRIKINTKILEIIEKWGNQKQNDNTHIFPIIDSKMSIEKQRIVIQQNTRLINKHMEGLGKKIGIDLKISTQAARHSFATTMMRNDISIGFISDSLGHSNYKTTQNYLAGFEDETHSKAASILSELTTSDER
jgi:integrase